MTSKNRELYELNKKLYEEYVADAHRYSDMGEEAMAKQSMREAQSKKKAMNHYKEKSNVR